MQVQKMPHSIIVILNVLMMHYVVQVNMLVADLHCSQVNRSIQHHAKELISMIVIYIQKLKEHNI